jgi:hypothetical protein
MNTNSKCFKEQVQTHLIERLSTDYTTNLKEQLQNVVNEFTNWYGPYEQKQRPNRQDAFIDWLWGLPSCLNAEYENYNISLAYRSFFENCGMQPRYTDQDKMNFYYMYWIFREFQTLCKKEGVRF